MPSGNLKELVLYQKCIELRKNVSFMVKKHLPSEEKFRLADQMIRCSRSITANIAEGHGRFHYQENMQYCRMARGSLYELNDHIDVALEERYIESELHQELEENIDHCTRLLNGYLKYIEKLKNKTK